MSAPVRPDALTDPRAAAAEQLRHGIAAAGRGDGVAAVDGFRRAVALQPDLAAAHANLGLLLVALGRHAEAEAPLRRAVEALPAEAPLHNALGVALEAGRRFAEAEASYRAALAVAPALPEAHANLGNCLRRLGRPAQADAHLTRAIALAPDFAAAHFNRGVLRQEREDFDGAAADYRRALACRADHPEALNNLGSCLRGLGAVDEARAAFEGALALRPTLLEAHCNLAPLKTYGAGDPHVAQLLSQQHRLQAMPADGRVRYWFTAGKMLEDVGRHDEAFAAYDRGNRAKRALSPWDEAAHVALQRRTIATFPRERLPATADPDDGEGPVPVFIVGMPRSGTSLLEQVLATLPGVHGAGEISDLPDVLQAASGGGGYPERLGACAPDEARRLGRQYLARVRALAPHASHVVDKLPDNFQHVGAIHRMLPGARIVHAMRDPVDTCFSCFSRLFTGDNLAYTYDLAGVGRYWLGYHALMRHWHAALPAGRILDVSYEAMVADLEGQARRLVAYLGLPWDDRCLAFHRNPRIVRTASVAQVRRPLYASSVARWKPFEPHLGPLLALLGPYR